MKVLRNFEASVDGFEVEFYPKLLDAEFSEAQRRAFYDLKVGKNSANRLLRGVRWGVYARDTFSWLQRNSYRLDSDKNPEEEGRTRYFSLMDEDFLCHPILTDVLRSCFSKHRFAESSYARAYEIQLSFIRYQPTLEQPALPSPIIPHQDAVDGTIIVLNKFGSLSGGLSRIYSLQNDPLFEIDLRTGESLFVVDSKIKHQVTPLQMEPDRDWRPGDLAFRDVMIVRYQPVGR
ncbi:2OG-Fe dioxygenase family protein [Parvularcula sp. LCG005]|uniref:2OG-Fe dioxygenase family protein n=1 Tax=Parvularcula sp. LCG005 TaxID=3078805 RepID=UPI00397C326F